MKMKPKTVNAAVAYSLFITSCLGFSLHSPPPVSLQHAIILMSPRHDQKQQLMMKRGRGGGGCSGITGKSDIPSRDHGSGNEECIYSGDTVIIAPTTTATSTTATRRSFLTSSTTAAASCTTFFVTMMPSVSARALKEDDAGLVNDAASTNVSSINRTKSTADATITDRIFIEFKGLSPPPPIAADGQYNTLNSDRIVIGLFGNDAPQPVSILKQLVTKEGYKDAKCKPLDASRTLIKEQLEANKVYNTCMETEDTAGVNYDYATVWRVIKNERVDVGAVSGRFVARENPNFVDSGSASGSGGSRLRHDAAGVVSVRRGNEGGFGFTIFPGGSGDDVRATEAAAAASTILDVENIVVGRILEGMDVVQRLNELPVVKQSAGSILGGATSGGKEKSKVAPSRGCRYGGTELYCNEYKPLRKVLLDETGVL